MKTHIQWQSSFLTVWKFSLQVLGIYRFHLGPQKLLNSILLYHRTCIMRSVAVRYQRGKVQKKPTCSQCWILDTTLCYDSVLLKEFFYLLSKNGRRYLLYPFIIFCIVGGRISLFPSASGICIDLKGIENEDFVKGHNKKKFPNTSDSIICVSVLLEKISFIP